MRKKWKSLTGVFLSLAMVVSLTACGKEATPSNGGTDNPTASPTKEASTSPEANKGTTDDTTGTEGGDTKDNTGEETYDFGGVTVKAFGGVWGRLDSEDIVDIEAKEEVEKKYNIKLVKAEMEGDDGTNTADLLISSVASKEPATHIIQLNPETMITCFVNDLLFDITDMKDELKVGSLYTDVATWKGRCYGVSYDNLGDAWSLIYDRKYLEEIGMEKTPTQMFMEGKWDYASFKAYLTEMKSKLPEGVYPFGMYPTRQSVMGAGANGTRIVDQSGKLSFKDEAFIESVAFYQELEEEGLAYPIKQITKEDGSVGYDIAYKIDDERVVIKQAEPWQFGSIPFEFGVTYWPWGSNVTCEGDYTTLSDNYYVSNPYWGFDGVMKAAIEKTGIPGEVLTKIIYDYQNAIESKEWMHEAWEAEQKGEDFVYGAEAGDPRNFYTEEDIELYDWAHGRYLPDYAWAMNSAGILNSDDVFVDIFCKYLDPRSTLEANYNKSLEALKEVGLGQ